MNKICFITGATSGIGKSCAEKFAANGFNLILCARRKQRLDELKDDLETRFNSKVFAFELDVRIHKDVKMAVDTLPTDWQKIDILINNAGLAAGLSNFQSGDVADWEQMIDTNLKGLLYVSRAIAPLMIQNGFGHIINISSVAGKEVYANGNVYCATKHAVDALSKAMRIDLLSHGIKVTNIAPGMTETEFSLVRYKGDTERANAVYEGVEALTGEDIADVIFFAATLPAHVNINDLTITPTAQASAFYVTRK